MSCFSRKGVNAFVTTPARCWSKAALSGNSLRSGQPSAIVFLAKETERRGGGGGGGEQTDRKREDRDKQTVGEKDGMGWTRRERGERERQTDRQTDRQTEMID